jgi:hypothetical protein
MITHINLQTIFFQKHIEVVKLNGVDYRSENVIYLLFSTKLRVTLDLLFRFVES